MDTTNATPAELTITHTHADGTLIDGSRPGGGVWEVLRTVGGWKCGRRVGLYVPNSRDRDANRPHIDRTAAALRAAGWEVAEDIDNTSPTTAEREAARAERAERRADRYAERAGKAAAVEQRHRDAENAIGDHMPFGEPVKIGHHSERAHRRAFEKMDAHRGKAIDAADKARRLSQRADAVGHHLAHRADPRVTMRRIERLEADRRLWERRDDERATREVARLAEEIAHWRAELDAMRAAEVFVPWGPEHFTKGDAVNVHGRWYPVVRVNRKSVSVPPLIGMGSTETADGVAWSWTDTVPWDKIGGRRRDGMQLDTPNGEPWPVDLARKAARWARLVQSVGRGGYDDDARRQDRHVSWAQRIAHRLDLGAADAEVFACEPDDGDTDARRALAAAYLNVFDRLTAGERVPDILADLPEVPQVEPEWRMPDGDPQRLPVREVNPGDIVQGMYERGFAGSGEMLLRSFAGPVAEVVPHTGDEYSGERFIGWWEVVLTTGERREFKPWQMLAVHPAEPVADVVPEPETGAAVVVYGGAATRAGVLVDPTDSDDDNGAVRVLCDGDTQPRSYAVGIVVPLADAADAWHVVDGAGAVVAGGPGISEGRAGEIAAEHADGPRTVVRGIPGVTCDPEPTAVDRWQALEAANADRPGSRATHDRIRRQAVAWHGVHGVADDHVGSVDTDSYPGTEEEKAAALLAEYAALLAADGAKRTHPAEPEPTPEVAPAPAVAPAVPINPWDDLLAAHLHAA